jgi:hypothetical protein
MVYRYLIFILLFIYNISLSEIIYDKQKIVITKNDLEIFKSFYKTEFNIDINDQDALKKYTLNLKKINKLDQSNNNLRNDIDKIIELKFNNENLKIEPVRVFIFYNEIQNEFINEYYINNFYYSDFRIVAKNFDNTKVGISINQCLTIDRFIELDENTIFLDKIYNFIKNKDSKILIELNVNKYEVCITDPVVRKIEKSIYLYIKKKIEKDLLKYLYS